MLASESDPGPTQSAVAEYRTGGLVIFEPTYQLLVAEVLASAGDLEGARDAVRASRAVTEMTGEVPIGPRLQLVADRVLALPA